VDVRSLKYLSTALLLCIFAMQAHGGECVSSCTGVEAQEPSIGLLSAVFEQIQDTFHIADNAEHRSRPDNLLQKIKTSSRIARGIIGTPPLGDILAALPELQEALKHDPKLLDPLRKKSALAELYALNSGADRQQSVEHQTLQALDQLANQTRFEDLETLDVNSTNDVVLLTRYTIALRRLGEGIAFRAGDAKLAETLNPIIVRRILGHLGFSKKSVRLAEALITNSELQALLEGSLSPEEAARRITLLSKQTGESPATLFKLQTLIFSSSAAADPILREKLLRQEQIGRWVPKSPRFGELGQLIAKSQPASHLPDYHPFVSTEAKELFLRDYGRRAAAWPIPSEELYVDTPYGKTFVRVSGPIDAPPLILLPGANTSSLMWIPNIEDLAKAHRVFAVDSVASYGRTVTDRSIKSSKQYTAWLNELLTNLRIDKKVDLVGVSYGGWIASEFALRHPERLNKLVLLAPAATVQPIKAEFLIRILLSNLPPRSKSQDIYSWLCNDSLKNSDQTRASLEDLKGERALGESTFKSSVPARPRNLSDAELQGFKMPVLFVAGENDKIYSTKDAITRLNRVAPLIKTDLIPKAGHDLTIAQPKLVDDKILGFLEESGTE